MKKYKSKCFCPIENNPEQLEKKKDKTVLDIAEEIAFWILCMPFIICLIPLIPLFLIVYIMDECPWIYLIFLSLAAYYALISWFISFIGGW